MATGWKKFGSTYYYFDKSTGVAKTGWQTLPIYGKLTYGWQQISSKWYYFDKNNGGAAVVNTSKKIGNKTYKFNKDGVCTNK